MLKINTEVEYMEKLKDFDWFSFCLRAYTYTHIFQYSEFDQITCRVNKSKNLKIEEMFAWFILYICVFKYISYINL